MNSVLADIRFAIRQLRRAPGFATIALLTLALAIGATTAMVSVLRATLLNPTHFASISQLVAIKDTNLKGFKANGIMTVARAGDLAQFSLDKQHKLFRNVAFFFIDEPALMVGGHSPVSTSATDASGEFFGVLGTAPLLGRTFNPVDDKQGAPNVAVISYGLWQRSFGGSRSVIGANIRLAGAPVTVIGVMPKQFDYPVGTDIWKPAHFSAQSFGGYRGTETRFVNVIGRLADHTTVNQARGGTGLLAAQLAHSYPATDADWGFKVTSLQSEILTNYREGLWLLSAAVGVLLLIACSNIAGLILSRNATRQGEHAIRRALGISSRRFLQQLLTESLVLFAAGGALGLGIAAGLLRLLVTKLPADLLSFSLPRFDFQTLIIVSAVTFAASVVCGVMPALQSGVLAPRHSQSIVRSTQRFGRAFAIAQMALALVLLALASSLLSNFLLLLERPLGYQPSHVLALSVHLPFGTDLAKAHRFYQELERRFAAMPGIDSVGAISALPDESFTVLGLNDVAGRSPTPHQDATSAEVRTITPGYLTTMHIPLLAGRLFKAQDSDPKTPQVALVNQSFREKYFPGANPVGRRLVNKRGEAEIVGVIGDVQGPENSSDSTGRPELDEPENGGWPDMHFVLRTPLPASALEPELRRQLASLDPGVAFGAVEPLSLSLDKALAEPRLNSALLAALAGVALVLVVVGVYGVVAFSIAQRTRELALRLALGASRGIIFRMLLHESGRMLVPGIALGVAGSVVSLRLLSFVMSVASRPGATLLLTACFLLSAAVLTASIVPARRAALIDPMQALRTE